MDNENLTVFAQDELDSELLCYDNSPKCGLKLEPKIH